MSLLKNWTKQQQDKAYVNSANVAYDNKIDYISPILKNFCLSRVHNQSDAIDVAQNTIFILIQKRNEYNEKLNFYGWAFEICRYQIKKYLTIAKRNREDCYSPDSFGYQLNLIDELCPLSVKLKKELKKEQIRLLNKIKKEKMGEKEKRFFELSLQGCSREEIMEILNLRQGSYYQMKSRVAKKLKSNV